MIKVSAEGQFSPSLEKNAPDSPHREAPRLDHDSLNGWTDERLLGFTPMDEVHREFFHVTAALLSCSQESALEAIAYFEDHARRHFDQEDQWMVETDFPARDCHIHEHASVLASTIDVRRAIAEGQGGAALAADFAQHLLAWFPGHADYLDSALAAWMCKRRWGGRPVVLRRRNR